jgi:hypothetical protein
MAKLEIIHGRGLFNLDADVGRASPNRLDDVELVRFGYFCLKVSSSLRSRTSPRVKAALESLNPRGPFAPDLDEVISAHQSDRGGTQDGKVSVGKPQATHSFNYDTKNSWIIFSLSMPMIERIPNLYPRIDIDAISGPEISKKVRELFNID